MPGNGHVRFGPGAVGKGPATQTPRQRPTGTLRHTASRGHLFAVAVERGAGTRLTVADLGSAETEPTMGNAGLEDMHGHGLALVAELSDSWGCVGDHTGRDVWARWNAAS